MTKSRKLAYLALLITAIIWGIAPPVIKYTLRFLSPFAFLFYRFLLASIIIAAPTILKLKKIKLNLRDWLLYLFLGFLCTPLNLILLFLGIQKTTAIDASLISIISPILVIIGGVLFLDEKVNKTERIGIIITIAGTIITMVQPFFENNINIGRSIFGNFLVFLGTLVWVAFTLLAKKNHRDRLDPLVLTGLSFWVGLITMIPLFLYERLALNDYLKSIFLTTQPIFFLDPRALPGVLFMAIFSSIVAYFAYIYGLTKIEASEATIFTYLQPIFAVPIAVIFLKETLSLAFIFGSVLIILGVFICEYRFNKRKA